MPILEKLQPQAVFAHFEQLCAIPHGSGNTKAISDYLVRFAAARGLRHIQDAHNNVIKLPKDRMAVISGLDGFIVAEEKNVLLICRKEDSSANVRRLVNEIQMKKGEEFI